MYNTIQNQISEYNKKVGRKQNQDGLYYVVKQFPIGDVLIISEKEGIVLLAFLDQKGLLRQLEKLDLVYHSGWMNQCNNHIVQVLEELDAYFKKALRQFQVPCVFIGTPFQKAVWNILRTIPYGEVMTYKSQALALGREKAVRAVAHANSQNMISIVVPCHRVIGTNGDLKGYAGGIDKKRHLLTLEQDGDDPNHALLSHLKRCKSAN